MNKVEFEKSLAKKLIIIDRRLKTTNLIENRRKRLKELLSIRRDLKIMLNDYKSNPVLKEDLSYYNKILKKIKTFIYFSEKLK